MWTLECQFLISILISHCSSVTDMHHVSRTACGPCDVDLSLAVSFSSVTESVHATCVKDSVDHGRSRTACGPWVVDFSLVVLLFL